MTYHRYQSGSQTTLVHDEVYALNLFGLQQAVYNGNARAMIVAKSFRDCDGYLDAGSLLLSDKSGIARRTRGKGCVAEWEFRNGASIRLDYFPSLNAAQLYAGRDFSFMIFHDPASWHEPEIMQWFLSTLRSRTIPTRLVTVKSPLTLPTRPSNDADRTEQAIDYSAITRSVIG